MNNTKELDTSSGDAISSLPDEILGDILSLLPTKQAASTSVLAKKWRNVYRFVHNLDFDDSVLIKPEEDNPMRGHIPESFLNFVDRTFQYCGTTLIKKFSLNCYIYNESETAHVRRWLRNAVERGVLELNLSFNTSCRPLSLPSQLFTSKTLVKLTLGTRSSHEALDLPSYVSLPSLKILLVHTAFFANRYLSDLLLAGCPVLEELIVHRNDVANPHTIKSHSVKRLSLFDYKHDRYHYGYGYIDYSLMSLDLPNLVYLDYSSFALSQYPQAELDSLVEAKLDLQWFKLETYDQSDLRKLIVGIRNVEILHLSRGSVDVISLCVKHGLLLPMFDNLINLYFGSEKKGGWILLAYLLKQSPKLETLTIEDLNFYPAGGISMASTKVKALHVLSYRGTSTESKQLKSLLRKLKSLEMVQVRVTKKEDKLERILQTKRYLVKLRGVVLPSNCEIKVV